MRNEYTDPEESRLSGSDRDIERVLRPQQFNDFTGQDKVIENLNIFVQAARQRGEALDHVLITALLPEACASSTRFINL